VFQLMKCSCIIPVGTKASSPAFESFQSHGKWRSSASFSVGGLAQPVTATGSFPGPLSHVFQLMNCSRIIPVGTKASSPAFESFQSHGKWWSSASFSVDGRAQPVTATGLLILPWRLKVPPATTSTTPTLTWSPVLLLRLPPRNR